MGSMYRRISRLSIYDYTETHVYEISSFIYTLGIHVIKKVRKIYIVETFLIFNLNVRKNETNKLRN